MTKSIFASKTFYLNLVGILMTLLETGEVIDLLPPDYQAMVPAALGVLNIIVRFKTSQPVSLKPPR